MRISLVISSLGSGGAERVLTGIANFLQEKGHDITLITYLAATSDYYILNPEINRVRLDCGANSKSIIQGSFNAFKRVEVLRHAILGSKPDRVISFIDRCNVLTLLACVGTNIPVIVSERTNPIYYPIGKTWNVLRKLLYRRADQLVIQTENLNHWAQSHINKSRISVIPNALDADRLNEINNAYRIDNKLPWQKSIITMGRFTHEKGHDLLLRSVKPLLEKNLDWGLEIIGDGPLKSNLISLTNELGLQDRVFFHGKVNIPFNLLKSADIFVLPSRIEGFPNVLLEAMSLGLPCVSFNCPSGPSDMIDDNHNGLLVEKEDVKSMTKAIKRCMDSEDLRVRLGLEAKNIIYSYTEEQIMSKWESILCVT